MRKTPDKVTRVLREQWSSEIESKEIYYNYRMFKNVFTPEDYLQILPLNLAYTFVHFSHSSGAV